MVKIVTTSHGVIESKDSFATIQRAIQNKQFIEVNQGLTRYFINPEHIVTLEGDEEATRKPYSNPAASNFPFPMTKEETEEMQNKMQPLKPFFDAKKKAMEEMAKKESDKMNLAYETMYGKYKQDIEAVVPKEAVEEPAKKPKKDK